MTDPWWWAAIGAAVGAGGAIPSLLKLASRLLRPARKSDDEVAADLRDALLLEIARLRTRIEVLEIRADNLQEKLVDCEERSADLERENRLVKEHAEALATRVAHLEGRAVS